jgi:thioesterase domain-containing protein
MKAGQPGPVVVMVPGYGGSVGRLTALATGLVTTMRVVAIEGRGLNGAVPPDSSVQDMAAHYLAQIEAAGVPAPYYLVGHSFGGLVALEMARRLLSSGKTVACLIILDSNVAERLWGWRYYLKITAGRLAGRLREFAATPGRYKPLYVRFMLDKYLRKFDRQELPVQGALAVMAAHEFAFSQYDPGIYPDRVIFFRAAQEDFPADPEALWRHRVRELEIRVAAGGHLGMLDMPHMLGLAAEISACLAQAGGP